MEKLHRKYIYSQVVASSLMLLENLPTMVVVLVDRTHHYKTPTITTPILNVNLPLPRDLGIQQQHIQKFEGVECLKTCEGQLSPSKSLHAAMLKSRFADTILKAQQKTLSIGERVDPLKVKQGERERFEKKQREEKARIDAHVKAVKEEAALKLLRQRQAARLALEEMEKSIDVYDSFAIMKDLEMMGVAKCIGHDRVLEGLGLYLKKEFPEDNDDDVEEGEIIR